MARKTRIDSTAAAVDIARAAGQQISPPSNVPLDDCDLPFFASVLSEFARSEWTAHQLELAAMLARTMANLEREQRTLRAEGFTAKSDRGTPVANPLAAVCKGLAGDVLSMRRSLSLHARAQSGEGRDVGKRRALTKEAEGGANDDDGLLARPN